MIQQFLLNKYGKRIFVSLFSIFFLAVIVCAEDTERIGLAKISWEYTDYPADTEEVHIFGYENQSARVYGLEQLSHLKTLFVSGMAYFDFSSLKDCTSIETLVIQDSELHSIDFLKNLTHLKTLVLQSVTLPEGKVDFSNLTSLEYIEISNLPKEHDIHTILFPAKIKWINVAYAKITDTKPLEKYKNATIILTGNTITSKKTKSNWFTGDPGELMDFLPKEYSQFIR